MPKSGGVLRRLHIAPVGARRNGIDTPAHVIAGTRRTSPAMTIP